MLTRSRSTTGCLALLAWMAAATAIAGLQSLDGSGAAVPPLPSMSTADGPAAPGPWPDDPALDPAGDVASWALRQTTAGLLQADAEQGRLAVLQQGWQPVGPTWMQGSALVNLGDYPRLDRSAEKAENDLKALEWVIEEQRRLGAGRPSQAAGDVGDEEDRLWLRRLLPSHWIALLKAHREWVAAGGTALLVIVWAGAALSRTWRTAPSSAVSEPQPPPPRRRHRRRHRNGVTRSA